MKILVVYASKHGATRRIAEQIAETLEHLGNETVVGPVEVADDPGAYDAVVIGSAIYYGAWRKDAVEYVHAHRAELASRPVWLFSSGPTGTSPVPDPKVLAELRAAIGPRGHHMFAGAIDHSQLSLAERAIVKMVKAPEGDFRDWDEIVAWAKSISVALATEAPATVGSQA